MNKRLVIVGAGMATSRLLTELARHAHNFDITVIGEERHACYNRILLSSLLARETTLAQTSLIKPAWYSQNRITLRTGEKVTGLDPAVRRLVTTRDKQMDYDSLVLATGSSPFVPPIPGTELDNVLTFRNLPDLEQIDRLAQPGARAVIIGGGLLGLEAAYGLRKLGTGTTVINRERWLMPRQLSERAATVLRGRLEDQGMVFHLGVTPQAIVGRANRASGVRLSDGVCLDCDLVLITAGIQPNKALALQAGLRCDRGILIDSRLRTSAANIFAVGECAQLGTELFGLVAPVYQQAAVLAANLCGKDAREFVHEPTATQLKISGIDVVSSGRLDQPLPAGLDEQVVCDARQGIFRRLLFQDQRLVGFELVGDKRHAAAYAQLLRAAPADAPATHIMFQPDTQTEPGIAQLKRTGTHG